MLMHERDINRVVDRVVERLAADGTLSRRNERASGDSASGVTSGVPAVGDGVFATVDEALEAAKGAFAALSRFPFEKRDMIIGRIRNMVVANAEYLSRITVEETGMGRVEDKIDKNRLAAEKTPGVEALVTGAFSGDKGLTIEEFAPYGVIGAVIPSTNPTETVINNGIGTFAAGNAVIFNPHPNAKMCSTEMIRMMNRTTVENGGPENCFVCVAEPTITTAQTIMTHDDVALLVVTGAEGVVRAAMQSGKRVIAAGPGNPPAVVDETADIPKAARDIVAGASLDNNIVCIDEKVTVVVESVADQLVREMERAGGYRASANQVRQLERALFIERPAPGVHSPVKRSFVGRDARVLLEAIGTRASGDPRLILCEVSPDHPFAWTEMLMPVMPIVRMPNVDAAIEYAVSVERGNRHTASMHSKNIDKLAKMARAMNTSLFVKNAANFAGMGLGGEGYTSFTIASPTGDGLTTARTFSRKRRCALVGPYGIVTG